MSTYLSFWHSSTQLHVAMAHADGIGIVLDSEFCSPTFGELKSLGSGWAKAALKWLSSEQEYMILTATRDEMREGRPQVLLADPSTLINLAMGAGASLGAGRISWVIACNDPKIRLAVTHAVGSFAPVGVKPEGVAYPPSGRQTH